MTELEVLKKIRHEIGNVVGSYQTLKNIVSKSLDVDAANLFQACNERLNAVLTSLDSITKSGSGPKSSAKKIFLQFAMRIEAKPLIEKLGAKKVSGWQWHNGLPFEFYEARFGDCDLIIGVAGVDPNHSVDSIGSVPAAVLTQLVIQNLAPSLIINAGTCGGFQSLGHEIAQVFVGTKHVVFHHRRSSIPAMREYGIGRYPVVDTTKLRASLSLPDGVVTSGDALDFSAEDKEYITSNGGTLKEMEAAAIGWVASFHKTPLLPIKTVTDWVDHPADTAQQFMVNYANSVANLTDVVLRVLKYLDENPKDSAWV